MLHPAFLVIMSLLSFLVLDLSILGADIAILASFIALFMQVRHRKSAAGVSLQTVGALAAARVIHLFSHPLNVHFRPDAFEDGLYTFLDIVNAGFSCYVLFYIFKDHIGSYETEKDNFSQNFFLKAGLDKQLVHKLRYAFVYILAAIFGLVWYMVRRSPQPFHVSYFCCYYEALLAIALLPQLWMFQQDRVVSPQLANFVALLAVSRLCTLVFWVSYPYVYWNRYPDNRGVQMASEILNLAILSDFLYYFIKARMQGQNVIVIPSAMNHV